MKYSVFFSIIVITQLMAIIMWGEYKWLYKYANGGVGGTAYEQINPVLFIFIIVECILFFCLLLSLKNVKKQ